MQLYLIEAAVSSSWDNIDALLQDREEDIDLNYSNQVCRHAHIFVLG